MKNLLKQLAPFMGLLLVVLIFSMIAPSEFLSFYNFKTIVTQTVIVGIAALGMTLVIISGGIDLSVGSQIALGTVATATLLNAGMGPAIAFLGGIAITKLCGMTIGVLSAKAKIIPFIVTLGMMQVARGAAKWLANEQTVTTPDNILQSLTLVDPDPEWLIFSPGVWIMVILTIATWILLKYTVFGRYIFAIGSNEKTAHLCGINVTWNRILIYTLSSAYVGIASVMQYANLTVGDPTAAAGMELDIIAAVVIGGGSLSGGEGSAIGSIIGALMMAVLRNGCNMLGVPNYVQEIIIGIIIVGAVAVDMLKHRLK